MYYYVLAFYVFWRQLTIVVEDVVFLHSQSMCHFGTEAAGSVVHIANGAKSWKTFAWNHSWRRICDSSRLGCVAEYGFAYDAPP